VEGYGKKKGGWGRRKKESGEGAKVKKKNGRYNPKKKRLKRGTAAPTQGRVKAKVGKR